MNKAHRERVNSYLSVCNTEPLEFYRQDWIGQTYKYSKAGDDDFIEALKISKEISLSDAILSLLSYTNAYASGINDNIETTPGRLRSVIDIWRHLKKYNPDLTIFEVMDSIYKDNSYLYSHYCGFIDRRVFCLADNDEYPEEINDWDDDEFGFNFDYWSDI